MEEFMSDWNNHPIRQNAIRHTIVGIPTDLYEMPEQHGIGLCMTLSGLCKLLFIVILWLYYRMSPMGSLL